MALLSSLAKFANSVGKAMASQKSQKPISSSSTPRNSSPKNNSPAISNGTVARTGKVTQPAQTNYSGMTPLGLPKNINIDQGHKNVYSSSWANEQNQKNTGGYDPNVITNPYNYANTADPFGSDVTKYLVANGYKPSTQGLKSGDTEWGQKYYHPEGKGFAYVDKYGVSHVSKDLVSALTYSKDGKISEWDGAYGGGYATNEKGGRIHLAGLDGAKLFGNFNDTNVYDRSYTDGYGNLRKNISGNDSPDSVSNNALNPFDIQRLLKDTQNVEQRIQTNNESKSYGASNPAQSSQQQGQYAYENYDVNGNMLGLTYGPSGKSNNLQGASYVKAPNGQIYQTANFGAQPQNNFVSNAGMQQQSQQTQMGMSSDYMNPQDYMVEDNSEAINAQYEAMARAQQAQLQSSLGQTLSDINSARSGLSAQYDPAKNDIYAQGRVNQQGIEEYMSSLGMEGGQNITAQARNNNSTQQAIGQVEAQKQAQDGVLQKAAIDAQRSSSMEELAQSYQVNAQKIQAILQDAQYTNQANLQAMKEAFQFNYQARADELARQQDMQKMQYQMQMDNRNFMYGASQDSRGNWWKQQQYEYEKMLNDRDYNFKVDQAKIDQSNWERQFNLSQQKKSSGSSRSSGGSRSSSSGSSSGGKYVDTNTMKASIYSTIDEKLNMVPMGSGGKTQYPGQFNTKAAQRWLDDNRNTIIQELGETAYKTYQTYINKKPSVGS